ncbi:MAG TPA: GDSL-type esterase/lipase family protein [Planctomycetota bacterium]|nr:GDSL-type esterase/lipase family protein [Planctomycetota bacterium]
MHPAPCRRARRLLRRAACVALLTLAACGDTAAAPPPAPSAGTPTELALPLVDLPQPPWLDLEGAKGIFPALTKENGRMEYDPLAMIVLRADKSYTFPFPEAEGGKISFATNNLGFREDAPTELQKNGRRILVLGDSQTEGVVNNKESFANVLEARLSQRGPPVEVINGGIGTTGPHNYLGLLLKHLDLRPDVIVVTIYDGNDFAHALQVEDTLRGRKVEPFPLAAREASKTRWPEQLPQSFNQAAVFHADPSAIDRALAATLTACRELARQADAIHARVIFLALPAKPDIDHDDDELQATMLETIGITREDVAVNCQLGARLLAALAAEGRETLDLLPVLRQAQGPLYWRKDYHLNVAGHAAVAAALLDVLGKGD